MAYELPNRTNEVLLRTDQTPAWFRFLHYTYTFLLFFIVGAAAFIYISLFRKGIMSITDVVPVQLGGIFVVLIFTGIAAFTTAEKNPSLMYRLLSLIPLLIILGFIGLIWYMPQLLAYF
jgi:hypothetical protein